MIALIVFLVVTLLVLFWVLHGRAWLKSRPWGWSQRLFAWLDPIELALWKKSETILFARFKVLLGAVLAFLVQIGQLDLTPMVYLFPEKHQDIARAFIQYVPLLISALGFVDEYLRRNTTKPIAVVAVPDAAPPEVERAVAKVEVANAVAVAAVENAKEQGAV